MSYESYWTRSSAATDYPRLVSHVTADEAVDVAVVGGGVAGICTAWELTRAGRRVVLVEADRIAAATTGNTTAKISVLQSRLYADLTSRRGAAAATLYARAQTDALDHLLAVVEELEIECGLERRPAYTYATVGEGVPALRDEAEAAAAAGVPVHFVTGTGLPFSIAGAVRVDGQAQFHPRRFLLALATDLIRQGSSIFEGSRVVTIDPGDPCVVVSTHGGSVAARDVVIATGFPVAATPAVRQALTTRRELVVAGPVPQERDPEGMYITQEEGTRSVRSAPYGPGERLLIATGEVFEPGSGGVGERYGALAQWAQTHFGLAEPEFRWSAQDYSSSDRVPLVGRGSPDPEHRHIWLATGFGGWGMTNAVAAARLIAGGIVSGEQAPWASIYDPSRFSADASGGEKAKPENGTVTLPVERHPIDPADAVAAAEVSVGRGEVVDVGGERCAVYRDEEGGLHAVTAVCSHLGCTVGFNDAERTWECPCHGSRFSVDGEVLQGPAVLPLSPAGNLMAALER